MAANHSAGRKRKKQAGTFALLIPIYLFMLIFVFAPLVYMVFLSFTTRAEVWGFVPEFTLDNFKRILEPLYLRTFGDSLKLAVTATIFIVLTRNIENILTNCE